MEQRELTWRKILRVLFRNLNGDCFQFLELCCYRRNKENLRFGQACTPQLQGQWTAFRMLCEVPSLNAALTLATASGLLQD
jgi:hypothetical protein